MRRGKILLLCILMMIPSANALVIDYTTEFQNTIEIAALLNYCNNCTDCSEKIQNANYGDTVRLTANITNHDGTCIEFNDADGIIFDGGNHLIDGDEDTNGYGISLAGYSNSNTLINCKITGFYHGIYLNTASHNTMQNITAYSNRNGIAIFYSGYNKIRDCILQENSRHDFYFVPNTLSNCDNTLVNVTSSGNRPISFYNQSVNLQDQEFSAIYLCNADNSVLNNITIKGSDIRKNNGLRIYYTDNSNMTDVVSSDNYEGINIDNSDSNNLQNITCINDYYGINLYDSESNNLQNIISTNNMYGIYISQCSYNTLENSVTNSNSQSGIRSYQSSNNIFTNIISNYNSYSGVDISIGSSATIKNSHIINNNIVGINLLNPNMNLIYNNYFNNTNNINFIGTIYANNWNTTNTLDTNIIGDPWLGGNYWATPSGTGFSEICMDNNDDGFCDTSYNLATSNIDHLPLTKYELILPRTIYVNETGWWVELNQFNPSTTPIQSAIDNSNNNDLVYVYGGHYAENVDVDKQITLQGESVDVVTVTASSPSDHVFDISVDNVNISGFTLTGTTLFGVGIYMDNINNCLISDNNVLNNHHGIWLYFSNNNTISGNIVKSSIENGIYLYYSDHNNITSNTANSSGSNGIYLRSSTYNNVTGNTANSSGSNGIYLSSLSDHNTLTDNNVSNNEKGIYIHYSINNTLSDNNIVGNIYNFGLYGSELSHYTHNIGSNNTVDGKPIYYLVNQKDQQVPTGAGFVGIVNCTNITVKNQILTNNSYGIMLSYSNSSVIENVTALNNADYGIFLWYSDKNTLANNIINSTGGGIYLYYSDKNILKNNTINATVYYGIYLESSDNNILTSNTVDSSSHYGIYVQLSDNNTIMNNTVNNNGDYGIIMDYSNDNNLTGNRIISNNSGYGIFLYSVENNLIYNNYFNNTYNVRFGGTLFSNYWNTTNTTGINIIDGSYFGGNYWAHPNGTGFSEICIDSDEDGFCDNYYNLTNDNIDYLPLSETNIQTYKIQLNAGANLISLPLQPVNTNILSVLNSTELDYRSVWTYYNNHWYRYDLSGPFYLNDLYNIEAGRGYWINMNSADNLTITGTIPNNTIHLVNGANLAGYNSIYPQNTIDAISSIEGNYISLWQYKNTHWYRYDLDGPSYLNDLIIMEPDYGYWININSTGCNWSI